MSETTVVLRNLSTHIRSLIQQNKEYKVINANLQSSIKGKTHELELLRAKVQELTKHCETLMTTRTICISDADKEKSKRQINHLLYSVNKCIALLSNEESEQVTTKE